MNLKIDNTALSGFRSLSEKGFLSIGKPKKQGSKSDEYTSTNLVLGTFRQECIDVSIELLGKFNSLQDAEDGLFGLYGILVQPGPRTFDYNNGITSLSFSGIVAKGAKVNTYYTGGKVYFIVKLKILKTSD